ncbi:MAG TPA: aminotransferase class IV [Methylomirabilota bacterium]|jgi:branched-chain amino acid aminotransferase|nr:aminotransferase class IV [Methylomirabilota bacterium]
MHGVAFIEGRYVPADEAKISVFDLGFSHSDAVYDVVSTWKGLFFRLDDHIDRFLRSCAGVRLACPYGKEDIKRILAQCVQRAELQDAYVEVLTTRGRFLIPGSRDIRQTKPTFLAYAVPYVWIATPEKQQKGLHVYIAKTQRISDDAVAARFKNFHWGDLTKGQLEALDAGADVAVLCGATGYLAEGPGFNIFFVKAGRIFTPRLNVLEGITRRTVMDLAQEIGVELEAGDYRADALRSADEAFISSTAGGIMPVTKVDGKPLGDGNPGAITWRLRELYWAKRETGWLGTRVEDLLQS